MASKPKAAHDLAEQGVKSAEKGDGRKSEELIDRAERLDPDALEAVAQETEERRRD